MRNDIGKFVNEVLDLVEKKEDLDQILFDVFSLQDRIGYKSVENIAGDEVEKRKALVKSEMNNLGSDILKEYFDKILASNSEAWVFEPGRFKVFAEELKEAAEKLIFFRLITAIELKKEDLQDITRKLSKKMERRVLVDLTVDKSIIGGAIIQKDGYILDFSLKNKLQNLNLEWKRTIQQAQQHA